MNPNPFRHWVWDQGGLTLQVPCVQDRTGVQLARTTLERCRLGAGDFLPLTTGANQSDKGWLCFTALTFNNPTWDPAWGGHLELWAEWDQAPTISYLPVHRRVILLEYGDRHWWGFPVPVRGPALLSVDIVSYWSNYPPEGSSAPHQGFPHPKGVLLQ